jgi:hypothetical protein
MRLSRTAFCPLTNPGFEGKVSYGAKSQRNDCDGPVGFVTNFFGDRFDGRLSYHFRKLLSSFVN